LIQLFPERSSPGVEPRGTAGDAVQAQSKNSIARCNWRARLAGFQQCLDQHPGPRLLILSKVEAEHPWRQALLEIENPLPEQRKSQRPRQLQRQEKDGRGQAAGNLNSVLRRCVEFFQRNPGPRGWTGSCNSSATFHVQIRQPQAATGFPESD